MDSTLPNSIYFNVFDINSIKFSSNSTNCWQTIFGPTRNTHPWFWRFTNCIRSETCCWHWRCDDIFMRIYTTFGYMQWNSVAWDDIGFILSYTNLWLIKIFFQRNSFRLQLFQKKDIHHFGWDCEIDGFIFKLWRLRTPTDRNATKEFNGICMILPENTRNSDLTNFGAYLIKSTVEEKIYLITRLKEGQWIIFGNGFTSIWKQKNSNNTFSVEIIWLYKTVYQMNQFQLLFTYSEFQLIHLDSKTFVCCTTHLIYAIFGTQFSTHGLFTGLLVQLFFYFRNAFKNWNTENATAKFS